MRTIVVTVALALALSLGSVPAQSSGSAPAVVVSVTGWAPKGAVVTFGHGADSYSGKFPLHRTLPYSENYFSYFVAAKLKNGGRITCTVKIGTAVKVGHARGGHHRCYAMLKNYGQGNWR